MNALEKKLHENFLQLSPQVAPGFLLRAYHHGKKVCDVSWGKTWTYYDLASLTKIFFTVPWMIRSVEQNRIDVFYRLPKLMPWYLHSVTAKDLLSHTAGNEWWQPFYKMLDSTQGIEFRKMQLKSKLRESPLSSQGGKAVYSDIDFFLLGFLLETVYQKNWLDLWGELSEVLFKKNGLFFQPQNQIQFKQESYAPTEKCPWRHRLLQGEVHDENAWALGGVAPHAGLFGSMDAVGEWAVWWRSQFYGLEEKPWFSRELAKKFTERAVSEDKGDWSLGFMLPTLGSASCGKYFSKESFGHTGFTGTSFWMDPEKDLMVLLLSNRIYPNRSNELFKKARPQIHDWVCEALGVV